MSRISRRGSRARANRRRRTGGNPAVLLFGILFVLVTGAAALWWWSRTPSPRGEAPAVLQKIPARQLPAAQPPVQQGYTTPSVKPHPQPHRAGHLSGEVAIIIDDMGKSVHELDRLAAIGVPITFAIIPGLPNDKGVARAAAARGMEVMLHLPMEPKGGRRLEDNGLYSDMTAEELEKRVRGYMSLIPGAAGANNHMGSLFTEKKDRMQPVLKVLREKGMFFVDSKTSADSVGYAVAREMGVRTAARDVFLDNVQEREAIHVQLEQAVHLAARKGSAIAICHPHEATIQALAEFLPKYRAQGIVFVTASRLVK